MKTKATALLVTCVLTSLARPTHAKATNDASQAFWELDSEASQTTRAPQGDSVWANRAKIGSEQSRKEPIVGKFAGNIYKDEFFSDSVYYDYIAAFWQGYNMQLYSNANECLDEGSNTMDSLHQWHLTSTRRKKNTELWDLFFTVLGTDFNEGWYKCFLFYDDITNTYLTKWAAFNDFGDIYLSFIFNMLSNSLNIKTQTENMIEAYQSHDTVVFVRSLASLLKSVIDFDSYTSVSGSNVEATAENFYGFTKKNTYVPPLWERQAAQEERIVKAKARHAELVKEKELERRQRRHSEVNVMEYTVHTMMSGGDPFVQLGEGHKWKARDYIQAPIGLLIGALHALPSDTSGPACSSNSTSFRSFLLEGIDYNRKTDKLQKAFAFYTSFSYLDEVGVKCQEAITETLGPDYWTTFADKWYINLAINLAYNAGFMWVDVINFIYFTPATVPQNDWGFFVSYLLGDFILRFFYHDPTPQQVQE